MARLRSLSILIVAVLVATASAPSMQTSALRVLEAAPNGVINQLTDANEIRVIFSEPMVALGRVPSNPTPPWIHIAPAMKGAFRWSGTTILIFTPDAKTPLPYATQFVVTIDRTAESAAGHQLAAVLPVHVHDADRQAHVRGVGAAGAAFRQPGGLGVDLQSARSAGGCAGAHERAVRAAQLEGADAVWRRARAPAGDRPGWLAAFRREGGRHVSGRQGHGRGARAPRAQLGPQPLQPAEHHGGARNDVAAATGELAADHGGRGDAESWRRGHARPAANVDEPTRPCAVRDRRGMRD